MSKGGSLKYFTVEQVVDALKSGSATLYQIRQNQYVAASRGYTEREALFKTAIELFDQWRKEKK
ncbi:hypothetical protein [Klebsiella pneumoniae]|uniref:hypothetical protein n=1 Tax=Klebsiella pneumoniae TaxID=573 RepID=UPI001009E354|nr:hypothetical protein [Klebsiella pneumoniae]MBC5479737.1 hypothetical protein [Klebsiella pneumoniae]MBZ1556288.1 hypothetical protein [Klebsiella pneumoniae]MCM6523211.1 hypothetical protein [Klebsiella pneumoniae]MCM6641330.1 hypothetical protein [Klebsiella pneumoniae]UAC59045.1 hypothetical protein K8B77_22500 [Klebsiella pneumoniae]